MSQNEQIWVRKKSDHSNTRQMTARAFEVNSDRWELIPDPQMEVDRSQLAIQAAQKKRVAERVGEETTVETTDEHKTEFVDVDSDFQSIEDMIPATRPFEELPVNEPDSEIETLRSEYELKTGKPADKRWKETRIKVELEKLNNPENAQA